MDKHGRPMPKGGRTPHEPYRIDPHGRRSGSLCHRGHQFAKSPGDHCIIGDVAGHGGPGVRQCSATRPLVGTSAPRRTVCGGEARVEAQGEIGSESNDCLAGEGSCRRQCRSLPRSQFRGQHCRVIVSGTPDRMAQGPPVPALGKNARNPVRGRLSDHGLAGSQPRGTCRCFGRWCALRSSAPRKHFRRLVRQRCHHVECDRRSAVALPLRGAGARTQTTGTDVRVSRHGHDAHGHAVHALTEISFRTLRGGLTNNIVGFLLVHSLALDRGIRVRGAGAAVYLMTVAKEFHRFKSYVLESAKY